MSGRSQASAGMQDPIAAAAGVAAAATVGPGLTRTEKLQRLKAKRLGQRPPAAGASAPPSSEPSQTAAAAAAGAGAGADRQQQAASSSSGGDAQGPPVRVSELIRRFREAPPLPRELRAHPPGGTLTGGHSTTWPTAAAAAAVSEDRPWWSSSGAAPKADGAMPGVAAAAAGGPGGELLSAAPGGSYPQVELGLESAQELDQLEWTDHAAAGAAAAAESEGWQGGLHGLDITVQQQGQPAAAAAAAGASTTLTPWTTDNLTAGVGWAGANHGFAKGAVGWGLAPPKAQQGGVSLPWAGAAAAVAAGVVVGSGCDGYGVQEEGDATAALLERCRRLLASKPVQHTAKQQQQQQAVRQQQQQQQQRMVPVGHGQQQHHQPDGSSTSTWRQQLVGPLVEISRPTSLMRFQWQMHAAA